MRLTIIFVLLILISAGLYALGPSSKEFDPKIEEIGAEKVRFLTALADDMEKNAEFRKIQPYKKRHFEHQMEFAQMTWRVQKSVEDRFGAEIAEQEKRIEAAMQRATPHEQMAIDKLLLLKQLAEALEGPIKLEPAKLTADLAKVDEHIQKLPEPLQKLILTKYANEFAAYQERIQATKKQKAESLGR